MNGLEFYGITVSGETTRRLHKNEGIHYDAIPRAIKAANDDKGGKVDLNELQKKSHMYLGENKCQDKFVKGAVGWSLSTYQDCLEIDFLIEGSDRR